MNNTEAEAVEVIDELDNFGEEIAATPDELVAIDDVVAVDEFTDELAEIDDLAAVDEVTVDDGEIDETTDEIIEADELVEIEETLAEIPAAESIADGVDLILPLALLVNPADFPEFFPAEKSPQKVGGKTTRRGASSKSNKKKAEAEIELTPEQLARRRKKDFQAKFIIYSVIIIFTLLFAGLLTYKLPGMLPRHFSQPIWPWSVIFAKGNYEPPASPAQPPIAPTEINATPAPTNSNDYQSDDGDDDRGDDPNEPASDTPPTDSTTDEDNFAW